MEYRPKEDVKNWRLCFTGNLLDQGARYVRNKQVMDFACEERSANARIVTSHSQCDVRIEAAPDSYSAEWNPARFYCSCGSKYMKRLTVGGVSQRYPVCGHEAAVLAVWEERRGGPWKFQETPEEVEARRERDRKEEEERRERLRREEERQRQREQDEKDRKVTVPAVNFFPAPEDDTFFRVRAAASKKKTTRYHFLRAQALLESGACTMKTPTVGYDETGDQILSAEGHFKQGGREFVAKVRLAERELADFRCSCRSWYYYSSLDPLCEHVLVVLSKLREYVQANNPGDATDKAADAFFQALDDLNSFAEEPARTVEKEKTVFLSPRITMDSGMARLSFKCGVRGGKGLTLRGYREFVDAVENEQPFQLSKAVTLDFARVDFEEDSLPWLQFLQRRVSETEVVNRQIERKQGNTYYYSTRTPTLSVNSRDILVGATLDRFYEIAEGMECEFQSKELDAPSSIRIGHMVMRVRLQSRRISTGGKFQGVEITGEMPVMLRGSAGSYIFNNRGLSRTTKEEERFLLPFREASDEEGKIRFRVGADHLAEFYYRVVPQLLQSPFVDFEDACAEEAATLLPPEPVFSFRVDIDGGMIVCEAEVTYGQSLAKPLMVSRAGEYQDGVQEERVDRTLQKYFRIFSPGRGKYETEGTDGNLYRFLTEGLPELERYGQVMGTEAFRRTTVRPAPSFRVNVSIDSGLLDLSILSKDADPEELLELLESYRQKKRFHRLRSGDFVTLSDNEQFASLDAIAQGLNITAEDVILHGAEMPVYRALYLDRLLAEHDDLVSSRDRTYRALIRNFASIRDADYEVPDAQSDVLRPYQVYGYKWLRTLTAAGFGGILADEMGLGKTLQTITLMQSLRDAGEQGAMLVVCPASLVFNWQEEFTRFAPALTVIPVAGAAAARKQLLQSLDPGAVYVTSYDLLRKDVALYDKLQFSVMVLDEAQYTKNQKAALTKAVKSIRAGHRFALTGTPIENRLAEMWSIFDFLMPGFLYGYTEFARRFETRITKSRDPEATARLKQMTGPFILRRLKADVLKDLPAKLEEVRYSRFEDEQRKIYDGQVVRMKKMLTEAGETGQDKIQIFAELMRIRQICCDPSLLFEDYQGGSAKREACLELIQNAIGGGHRMLVFSQFTSMLALLESDLNREGIAFYKITGSTPKEQRLRLVRDFNEGDTPVFLISLKAGGTGLNLTGADVVIHYDPWWNVAAQNQATDRAHRIGQTRQVTVYRMIAKDTIEEKILAMQEAKRDLADAILSGESASLASLSNEELMELLS